jgi:hypothetical protein
MADEAARENARLKADVHMAMHLVKVLGKRVEQLEGDLIYRLERLPLPEPDYEALGYPETNWRHTNIPFGCLVRLMKNNIVGGPTDNE